MSRGGGGNRHPGKKERAAGSLKKTLSWMAQNEARELGEAGTQRDLVKHTFSSSRHWEAVREFKTG